MQWKLAFTGFGKVAQEFARMLLSRQALLAQTYHLDWRITGIATGSHGCVVSASGINLQEALHCMKKAQSLVQLSGTTAVADTESFVDVCDADMMFETTPLSPMDGEPAATYIRKALQRGIDVISANKGPVACAYQELQELAKQHNAQWRFEGTVMDGTPIFNLQEFCLPAVAIKSFTGVLNSTTNVILTGMEEGRTFAEGLAEAQRLGIAEANADYDLEGWDAAVKAVALANVLMNANRHPREVQPQGIGGLSLADFAKARQQGKTYRLLASATLGDTGVHIEVAPQAVALDSWFANIKGTSSALVIATDLMGEIAVLEIHPRLTQTAYALLSDLLRIHEQSQRSK
ncbi:MAG: homoserine dehydrogenase [Acidobacteria bacterium]|nr:homoserine dehydrogenase [Acidobacteriota bacterium]